MSPESTPRRSAFPKPVIGLAGGIGSGKSWVGRQLQDLGCGIVDSDTAAHAVLRLPEVKDQLVRWWGKQVLDAAGEPDHSAIAAETFGKAENLRRLNALVHPRVAALRDRQMADFLADPRIKAVVWDTPLLFEAGLDRDCDAVIFVKTPYDKRLQRVRQTRGWSAEDLVKREKMQIPLDKKEHLADYIVDNSGDALACLHQIRDVFSQILARKVTPA